MQKILALITKYNERLKEIEDNYTNNGIFKDEYKGSDYEKEYIILSEITTDLLQIVEGGK